MYVVSIMSSGCYAKRFRDLDDAQEHIESAVSNGECIVIAADLEDLDEMGIDPDDVTVVDKDSES